MTSRPSLEDRVKNIESAVETLRHQPLIPLQPTMPFDVIPMHDVVIQSSSTMYHTCHVPTGFVVGLVECVDRFDQPRLVKPRVLDVRAGNQSMLLCPENIPLWRVQTLLPLMEIPIREGQDLLLELQAERDRSAHSSLAWCIRRDPTAAERRDLRRSIMHVHLDETGRGVSRQQYAVQILAALTASPIRRGMIKTGSHFVNILGSSHHNVFNVVGNLETNRAVPLECRAGEDIFVELALEPLLDSGMKPSQSDALEDGVTLLVEPKLDFGL